MSSLRISAALLLMTVAVCSGEVKVGNFNNRAHGIGGEVFIKDEKTLLIKGFTYDGAGPDAFFWAGTSAAPDDVGTILPYPFQGTFYHYDDQSAPILSRRFNGEEVELTLPEEMKATDLKWLSVWCRQFSVNFGDVYFPDDLQSEEEEEGTPEELPPPVIEPVHNAHDPNRHDDDWKEDGDAYSEAESESSAAEAESSAIQSRLSLSMLFCIVYAYLF